jgi:small subunit ribosomal protein S13
MVNKKTAKTKRTTSEGSHPTSAKKFEENENFRGIVRIAGKDIKGEIQLKDALRRVRGISHSLSTSILKLLNSKLGLDLKTKVGELSDGQIENIDKILYSLHEYDSIPKFMFNRCFDPESGKQNHVIMNDLLIADRNSVEYEKKIYSWRGYRHAYGQRVRGQRTRNTGRTGMAVGVLRKAVLAAQAGAAAAEKGRAAPAVSTASQAPAPVATKPAEKSVPKPSATEKK